jgi:hypothetical protein
MPAALSLPLRQEFSVGWAVRFPLDTRMNPASTSGSVLPIVALPEAWTTLFDLRSSCQRRNATGR